MFQLLSAQPNVEASDEPELDFIALLSSVGDDIQIQENESSGKTGFADHLVNPVLTIQAENGFEQAPVLIERGIVCWEILTTKISQNWWYWQKVYFVLRTLNSKGAK